MNRFRAFTRLALASLLLAAAGGCSNVPGLLDQAGLENGPYFTPVNFRGDVRLPTDLQRVALLPIHGGEVAGVESSAAMDAVLLTALQQQLRFEVVVISREECHRLFGLDDFSSVSALPAGFMAKLAQHFAVDAVLFTDLTVYRAYRPLALGFRCKLATTKEVRMVWAFDEVFSADELRMRNSVRSFYHRADRAAPYDPVPAALQSPVRFGAVAADLMFRTLPPR